MLQDIYYRKEKCTLSRVPVHKFDKFSLQQYNSPNMVERPQGENQLPNYRSTEGLTLEQDRQLVELLKLWPGGPISTPAFTELARMIPQPIVEVVVLRKNGDRLETLLIPRPDDDIVWPGMYHTPGAALRAADFKRDDGNPLNGPFERIQRAELGSEFNAIPSFAGRIHRLGDRGPEVAEIYVAELLVDIHSPQNHIWYPVEDLAENPKFIQGQLGHVRLAASKYLESYSGDDFKKVN